MGHPIAKCLKFPFEGLDSNAIANTNPVSRVINHDIFSVRGCD